MNTRIAVVLSCVLLASAPAAAAAEDADTLDWLIGRYAVMDATILGSTKSGELPRGTVLLDTATGRTWMLVDSGSHGVLWQPLPFGKYTGNLATTPQSVPTPK